MNSGLGSVRGARMAGESYSEARNTQQQRLTDPIVGATAKCNRQVGMMRSISSPE